MVVQAPDMPLVYITSSQIGKINTASQVVIVGSIILKTAGTSVWSLNDSSINIVSSSLTSVSQILPIGTSEFALVMSANSLSAGSTLAFTLSCTGKIYLFPLLMILCCSFASYSLISSDIWLHCNYLRFRCFKVIRYYDISRQCATSIGNLHCFSCNRIPVSDFLYYVRISMV